VYPARVRRLLGHYLGEGRTAAPWLGRCLIGLAQWRVARRNRAARREVMHMDEKLGKILAYTGRQE